MLTDSDVVAEPDTRGTVFQTDINDEACESDDSKIGADVDKSPGGCDTVIIAVPSSGQIVTSYNRIAD